MKLKKKNPTIYKQKVFNTKPQVIQKKSTEKKYQM